MENEYLHEMYLSVAREICPYAEVGMTIRIPILSDEGLPYMLLGSGGALWYIDYLIMPDIAISIENEGALRVTFI